MTNAKCEGIIKLWSSLLSKNDFVTLSVEDEAFLNISMLLQLFQFEFNRLKSNYINIKQELQNSIILNNSGNGNREASLSHEEKIITNKPSITCLEQFVGSPNENAEVNISLESTNQNLNNVGQNTAKVQDQQSPEFSYVFTFDKRTPKSANTSIDLFSDCVVISDDENSKKEKSELDQCGEKFLTSPTLSKRKRMSQMKRKIPFALLCSTEKENSISGTTDTRNQKETEKENSTSDAMDNGNQKVSRSPPSKKYKQCKLSLTFKKNNQKCDDGKDINLLRESNKNDQEFDTDATLFIPYSKPDHPENDGDELEVILEKLHDNRNKTVMEAPVSKPICEKLLEKNKSPTYAYKAEPVRKKADRAKLPGWTCEDCEKYYSALSGLSEEEKRKRINECSRHRSKYNEVSSTPPGFWNPEFTQI